ncbi:MAG: hypothetical protein ABSC38_02755 [Verrucomicrobiia bacterium]
MNKLTWKFTTIAAVAIAAVFAIHNYGLNLGLDLKGGTSYLLKLDFSKSGAKGGADMLQQAIGVISKRACADARIEGGGSPIGASHFGTNGISGVSSCASP